ncbi:MAG: molybdopterin-guanine dinucleotide biosynthesis protein MobB [Spirochaetota bacterium]
MSNSPSRLIVSFFGWSESGKTTLIEALIHACLRRGIACGAVKCTRALGAFEPEGKDSARFRSAGASPVAFVGTGVAGTTAIFIPTPDSPDRAWLEALFPGQGILFVEGLEVEGAIRVLVHRGEGPEKRSSSEVDILVCAESRRRAAWEAAGRLAFPPDAVEAILDLLEATWKGK